MHSEPGKGTTFRIELNGMSKLLLVDDDANTLASLARAFRLAGHEAVVCDQADRALELAKAQRFDVILSDVVMPGKDGLTLLAELKAAGVQTPVVMISGPSQHRDGRAGDAAGRDRFSREAALHREAAGHGRQHGEALAPGRREPAAAPARRQAGTGLEIGRDAGRHGQGGARGRERNARRDSGRNRHRQGTGRAHAAREKQPPQWSVRHAELRRGSRRADRIRTLRPRKRRVHRSRHAPPRQVRASPRRHAVPGRNRRHARADAGQAAARAGAEGSGAHRRRPAHSRWTCA